MISIFYYGVSRHDDNIDICTGKNKLSKFMLLLDKRKTNL